MNAINKTLLLAFVLLKIHLYEYVWCMGIDTAPEENPRNPPLYCYFKCKGSSFKYTAGTFLQRQIRRLAMAAICLSYRFPGDFHLSNISKGLWGQIFPFCFSLSKLETGKFDSTVIVTKCLNTFFVPSWSKLKQTENLLKIRSKIGLTWS